MTLGPDATWTWYDLPGTQCADGSSTGFAINPLSSGSGKVMIFLGGGGFCTDLSSCTPPLQTATHLNYGASNFASDMTSSSSKSEVLNVVPFGQYTWQKTLGARGIWDRTTTVNPFHDYNYVFLPYCTADLFYGSRHDTTSAFRTPSQVWFEGYSNFALYAQQIQALFPGAPSLALVGGSAGALGAAYNYGQLKALYPETPITVLADSGTPFWTGDEGFFPRQGFWMYSFEPPGVPSYEEDWFADAWGMDTTHPAGVAPVTRVGAHRSIYPAQSILLTVAGRSSDQFGFVEGSNDWVPPWYLHLNVLGTGHPDISDGQVDFSAHVNLANVHTLWISNGSAPNPNLRVWNQHHGYILDDVSVWSQTGLRAWLTQLGL